jgi:KaiC/GvpD/RAD55 family RecA-like ATPase
MNKHKPAEQVYPEPGALQIAGCGPEKALGLLDHFERIASLAEKHGLKDEFWREAQTPLSQVSKALPFTATQAALFAVLLANNDDDGVSIGDLAKTIKCGKIQLLKYMDEFEALEEKRYIRPVENCRATFLSGRSSRQARLPSYIIPMAVIKALRAGEEYKNKAYENLSPVNFFEAVNDVLADLSEDDFSVSDACYELKDLIKANGGLSAVKNLGNYDLGEGSVLVLFIFCEALFQESRERLPGSALNAFVGRSEARRIEGRLKTGEHKLVKFGLVEADCDDGMADQEYFRLTEKAKNEFLSEVDLKEKTKQRGRNIIRADTISEKQLFYPEKINRRIEELASLLREENFAGILKRLAEKKMRSGFACLFSGPPGTGKTETAYQIARETGRDIMLVDISETKSKWFGESEKRIQEVFDRYRGFAKDADLAPILLFNEADAVLGKRLSLGDSRTGPAQTENAMQNIILQEMEKLDGILIATTNMTCNLDKAFERRFLYKIEFEKPDSEAKKAIWRSTIPEIDDAAAESLASKFDFSGGQIENVARKQTVHSILTGEGISLDALKTLCEEEKMEKDARRMGFCAE